MVIWLGIEIQLEKCDAIFDSYDLLGSLSFSKHLGISLYLGVVFFIPTLCLVFMKLINLYFYVLSFFNLKTKFLLLDISPCGLILLYFFLIIFYLILSISVFLLYF